MTTLIASEARDAVPYVERVLMIDYLSSSKGWVYGWTHHLGTFLYRSDDEGRSWQKAKPQQHPQTALYRLGDGRWIGFTPPRSLQHWAAGRF